MSESKFVMAKKLSSVQTALMGETINDLSLDNLIPLIFKACLKENLCFWFNVIENELVLNLRDIGHENYELNIRQHYDIISFDGNMDSLKKQVLINAFLITSNNISVEENVANSDDSGDKLISTEKLPPKTINRVIKELHEKGIDVNRSSVKNNIPWSQLSTDERIKCTNYLKNMEASL